MSTRRYYPTDLTEEQWQFLLALLPARKWRPGGPGRPPCDLRRVINGIGYLLKTGCRWRMLSREFGKWTTIYGYFKRWRKLWVDGGYRAEWVTLWVKTLKHTRKIDLEVTDKEGPGFQVIPWRWAVERTHAWNGRARRHSKDYERKPESAAAMIHLSNIHLMLRKLAPSTQREFRYAAAA